MPNSAKFCRFIQVIICVQLLPPMAWGAIDSSEAARTEQTDTAISASSYSKSMNSDSSLSRSANNVLPESATHEVTGDGRTGFWVIGILINLSVMGWFLTWAVKEWRKKRGD